MEKIESIVFTLSRLANASEEETQRLIDKYSTMSEIEIIKDLSMLSYRMFSSNEGFYNYALTLIRSINPNKCPPIGEMKTILKSTFSNEIEGNITNINIGILIIKIDFFRFLKNILFHLY